MLEFRINFRTKTSTHSPFFRRLNFENGQFKNDSAIRPVSKICLFLSKSKTINLTENQENKIIENCLDWLIQDKKVASKAYSMRALYHFSKKYTWIKDELKMILSQDYPNHSSAYKAAAKDILKKLK